MTPRFPFLGFGLGLRPAHYADFLSSPQPVDWLEIISENFMLDGGPPLYHLEKMKEKYRIVPHGVSLSIGSADPLDFEYLTRLKKLIQFVDAPWFSDHICWTKIHGKHLHNLMPLPYTEDTIDFVSEKIRLVQDFIEKPFIFENVSSYVEFKQSQMTEWEFVSRVADAADCGILLDTHDHAIRDEVWELYTAATALFPHTSVLLERDDEIPALPELLDELGVARRKHARVEHVGS